MTRAVRGVAGAAAAALLLALAACGPSDPEQVLPEAFVDPPAVSAQAREAYGEEAELAYDEIADFVLQESMPEALLDPAAGAPTEAELVDGIVERMTPEAAAEWRAHVAADLAGDEDSRDVVRLLRFHTWEGTDVDAPRVGDVLRSQWVSDGVVDLASGAGDAAGTTAADGAARTAPAATGAPPEGLDVALSHHAKVRLVSNRVPIDVEVVRQLTFVLVPGDDGWLIESFEGSLSVPSSSTGR